MGDTLRNLLVLAMASVLATLAGSAAAYWRDEERRLRRMLRRALAAPPEMVIIARGRGLAAGINQAKGQIAILWDGGVKGLIYRLDQLVGGEVIVDDRVAARAFRGEPRRPLDEVASEAKRVLLRLVFDNPRDPDFELVLWPPVEPSKAQAGGAFEAVQAARRWVSSVEAILRQTPPEPAPRPVRIAEEAADDPSREDEGDG